MTLSDIEWLSKIFNDTKRRAVSLRQLSFLSWMFSVVVSLIVITSAIYCLERLVSEMSPSLLSYSFTEPVKRRVITWTILWLFTWDHETPTIATATPPSAKWFRSCCGGSPALGKLTNDAFRRPSIRMLSYITAMFSWVNRRLGDKYTYNACISALSPPGDGRVITL